MFAPAHEGIYDVLQSEMSSGISATLSVEAASPPVRRIVLLGARRETSDEDIRRVALAKLRDLIMGDPAATHLGVSLQHLLSEGSMSHVIEQSFSGPKPLQRFRNVQTRCGSYRCCLQNLVCCILSDFLRVSCIVRFVWCVRKAWGPPLVGTWLRPSIFSMGQLGLHCATLVLLFRVAVGE